MIYLGIDVAVPTASVFKASSNWRCIGNVGSSLGKSIMHSGSWVNSDENLNFTKIIEEITHRACSVLDFIFISVLGISDTS